MPVYKEEKTNTWRVIYRYTDWKGERKQTSKRGFATKREALAWEREQLNKVTADVDMTFASFIDRYTEDMKSRLKENTWSTKEHIIRTKLTPYFGKLRLSSITPQQIITWQNELMNYRDAQGQPYSPVYLRTIHNQLSAIFNHAVRYYKLRENPCQKAGTMGKKKAREMLFWTKEEYLQFAKAIQDKPMAYHAFQMLYWCGIREGELLALTPADFDFTRETVTISKSYQRLNGKTSSRSPKLKRAIEPSPCRISWRRRCKDISVPCTGCSQMTEYSPSPAASSTMRWSEAAVCLASKRFASMTCGIRPSPC